MGHRHMKGMEFAWPIAGVAVRIFRRLAVPGRVTQTLKEPMMSPKDLANSRHDPCAAPGDR